MTPIASYITSQAFLRLVLQGSPGSGKTTLACQLPRPYVIDLDKNLAGPLRWLVENKKGIPVGYDLVNVDEKGVTVPPFQRYLRLARLLNAASQDTSIDTIIIDSMTNLSDIMRDEVLRQQAKPEGTQLSQPLWGFFFVLGKNFVSQLTTCSKHIVLIAHEKIEKDEVDGSFKHFIYFPGQLAQILGGLVTDVWHCEVEEVPGNPPKHKFKVKTMPSFKFVGLKNSMSLPSEFEFTWDVVAKRLQVLQTPLEIKTT